MELPIPRDLADRLVDGGHLDKSFLDNLYLQSQTDPAEDQKNVAAQQVANAIASNPDIADVANRAAQIVQGNTGALPQPTTGTTSTTTTGPETRTVTSTGAPAIPATPRIDPVTAIRAQADADTVGQLHAADSFAQDGSPTNVYDSASKAFAIQQAGIIAEANAAAGGNAQMANAYKQAFDQLGKDAQEFSKKRAVIEAQRDQQLKAIQDHVAAFDKLTIDPSRFWNSRTTEQKIIAGIGLIFSSYGSAVSGGENQAMKVITDSIDKDIDLQKSEISLKKEQLAEQRNALADALRVTGDMDAAENIARAQATQRAALLINQIGAQTNSQVARAKATQAIGELMQKRDELLAKAMSPEALDRQRQANMSMQGQNGPIVLDSADKVTALPKEVLGSIVPGVGYAANQTAANEMVKGVNAYKNMMSALDQLIELRKKVGVETTSSQERARAGALQLAAETEWRIAAKAGALDKGSVDEFGKAVPSDPLGSKGFEVMGLGEKLGNAVMGDRVLARMEEFRKNAQQNHLNSIQSNMVAVYPKYADQINSQALTQKYPKR